MKQKIMLLGWCISVVLLLTQCNTAENVAEDTVAKPKLSHKIIGYVAGWRLNFQQQTIAANKLTHKAAFVKAQGLGGVMFWECSQDTEGYCSMHYLLNCSPLMKCNHK